MKDYNCPYRELLGVKYFTIWSPTKRNPCQSLLNQHQTTKCWNASIFTTIRWPLSEVLHDGNLWARNVQPLYTFSNQSAPFFWCCETWIDHDLQFAAFRFCSFCAMPINRFWLIGAKLINSLCNINAKGSNLCNVVKLISPPKNCCWIASNPISIIIAAEEAVTSINAALQHQSQLRC